jgi:hypothetical protein
MNESHEGWTAAARLALARHGVGQALAETVLGEVAAHCAGSGEQPWEAFGSPDEFALDVARERLPVAVRSRLDREALTAADYVSGGVTNLGLTAVVASLVLWAAFGATVPVSWAGLVGAVLVALVLFVLGGLRDAVRVAGRPRLVGPAHVLAVLVAVLAVVAFLGLPRTEIGRIPVLAIAAGGVVLTVLSFRYPRSRAEPDVKAATAATAQGSEPEDTERWLGRLAGLLEGRHELPRGRAAEMVEEARSHLAATGRAPDAEFGPVEEYALRLAEPTPARRIPWWRRPPVQTAVLAAAGTYWLVVNVLDQGPAWRTMLAAGVLLASGGPLAWRLIRAGRSSGDR